MSCALVGIPVSISRIHMQQPAQVVHSCYCKTDVKLEDQTKEIFYYCGSSDAMSGCQSWVIRTVAERVQKRNEKTQFSLSLASQLQRVESLVDIYHVILPVDWWLLRREAVKACYSTSSKSTSGRGTLKFKEWERLLSLKLQFLPPHHSWAVSWRRRSINSLWRRTPGFNPSPIHIGFLADILAMGEFSHHRQFHPANAPPTRFSFNYHRQHIILATDSLVEYTISLFLYPQFLAFFSSYFFIIKTMNYVASLSFRSHSFNKQ
jgi:hypothetical protein